jgi:glycosyltransferase involved in cell wall biosynthesis
VLSAHGTITSETPLHRDVYPELSGPQKWRAWKRFGRRYLFRPVWRAAMRHAAAVVVDSEFTRRELIERERIDAARIRVVPLGVREVAAQVDHAAARAALDIDTATVDLFTIGRLEWQKGHELALAALAELREFPWRYTIAGEGGYRAELERRVSALGIADRVVFAGRVNDLARERLLAAADLFVWPERTHPAFGLVGLEAMLQGTPVLASARGAIPEVVVAQPDPEAWLVRDVTRDGFRARLHTLFARPALLREARAGLRERALERFGFEKMIASTIEIYRNARPH